MERKQLYEVVAEVNTGLELFFLGDTFGDLKNEKILHYI